MATAVTYTALVNLVGFDNDAGAQCDHVEGLASTCHSLQWGSGRFRDNRVLGGVGIPVSPFVSDLTNSSSLISYIDPENGNAAWAGALRHAEDTGYYPLFVEGSYTYKENDYLLRSARTLMEIANETSNYVATEASKRHDLGFDADLAGDFRATIFKREVNKVDRPWKEFHFVPELSIYPTTATSSNTLYHLGHDIDWAIVDTNVPEFMVDVVQAQGNELVFNRTLSSFCSFGAEYPQTGGINDFIPALETCIKEGTSYLLTPYYPIETGSLNLYSYNGTDLAQWTQVTQTAFSTWASTANVYKVNPIMGEIYPKWDSPNSVNDFLASFNCYPLVEYRADVRGGREYHAKEVDVSRIVTNVNRGSTIYVLADAEKLINIELQISVEGLTESNGNLWQTTYYGDKPKKIIVRAINSANGEPVPSVPLKMERLNEVGILMGAIFAAPTVYTDDNGYAIFYYLPPALGDSIGLTNFSLSATSSQVLESTAVHDFWDDPASAENEIYLYGIYKDDPLLGRLPNWSTGLSATATDASDMVQWDASALNGRRRLMFLWDAAATHPNGSVGAFAAYRPGTVGSTSLEFSSDIPLADATDTSNMLGGYWVGGPRVANFRISVDEEKVGININTISESFSILVSLDDQMKGEYVSGGDRHPFGWKLSGGAIDAAVRLGGLLYMTVNPIAGDHVLTLHVDTSKYSASILSFSFTIQ